MDSVFDSMDRMKEEEILNEISDATHLFQKGEYQNAVKAYSACLHNLVHGRHREHQAGIHYNMALCYLKLKKYHKVIQECNSVIALNPKYVKVYGRKVKALCFIGRFVEAHEAALKWKTLEPESPQAKKEYDRLSIIVEAMQEEDEDGLNDSAFSPSLPSSGKLLNDEDRPQETQASGSRFKSGGRITTASTDRPMHGSFACSACQASFTSGEELERHIWAENHHQKASNKEETTQWKHRPPPRGFTSREYTKCPRYFGEETCRFGNRCSQAHSDSELAEWKERFEKRKERLQSAKDSDEQSGKWTEQLLKSWLNADSPESVMVECLEGVGVHEGSALTVKMTSKKCSHSWTFTITTKLCLRRVGLLDDTTSRHFSIASITTGKKKFQVSQSVGNDCQEWTNPGYVTTRDISERIYRIKVAFKTDIYGTLRQTLVFDFGSEPALVRNLCVESVSISDVEKLNKAILIDQDGRWDMEAMEVQQFIPRPNPLDQDEVRLLERYPPPMAGKFSVSEVMLEQDLQPSTYKQRMHDLLYIEEMAQFSNISKFNIKSNLHAVNRFMLMPSTVSVAKFAQNGELFAQLKLESEISEDTAHGRLILQNVNIVYLAQYDRRKPNQIPKKVYEAVVEEKGKNFIFIRLSQQTVVDFRVKNDSEFWAQVQFQLNRLPLCEMHEALDKLPDVNLVFPHLDSFDPIPWSPRMQWNYKWDSRLNAKQKEAVVAVTAGPGRCLPPILLVGPYGTGKTFTLAQATIQILQQDDDTRVLICTHSNSAADLYVKDYLHTHLEAGHKEMRPLRIYYQKRWINTVHPTVFDYCLVANRGTPQVQFRRPTREDIANHRVIVCTLSIARYLYDIGLEEGCFSHILLDEAAQAMECETIMPLALAGPQTRVVLAGDHMQMSPEVHSDFARERNLHMSFLERLYDFYPDSSQCKILLCENYRSHRAIIDFTSELFYENKLIASGNQPMHEHYYPLTFYTARGEDTQHQNSTTFYNNAEVYELVERVYELVKTWPDSWGPVEENGIGIVSPYADQVVRIRAELRKKKLGSISVERVFNVQGKQFRVIFLSTVRTRHTCSSDSSLEELIDYGFLSNVKLLNTAITRAQSLVAVVGDPVSLCSIGKCRKVWERFIEVCDKNHSLHGITWDILRSQLDGVELKKTYVLNPLAPVFVPNRLRHACYSAPEPVAFGKYGFTFSSSQPSRPPPPLMPRNAQLIPSHHPSMFYGQPMMHMALYPSFGPPVPRHMAWGVSKVTPLTSRAATLTGTPIQISPAVSPGSTTNPTSSNNSSKSAVSPAASTSPAGMEIRTTVRSVSKASAATGTPQTTSTPSASSTSHIMPLMMHAAPHPHPSIPHPSIPHPSIPHPSIQHPAFQQQPGQRPMPFFPPGHPVISPLYAMPPALMMPHHGPPHSSSRMTLAQPGQQQPGQVPPGQPYGPQFMSGHMVRHHIAMRPPVPLQVSPVTSPGASQNSPHQMVNGDAQSRHSASHPTDTPSPTTATTNSSETTMSGVQLLPTARNVTPDKVKQENMKSPVENGFKMPFNIDQKLLIQNPFLQKEVCMYIQQTQGQAAGQRFLLSLNNNPPSPHYLSENRKPAVPSWSQVVEKNPKPLEDEAIVSIGRGSKIEAVSVSVKSPHCDSALREPDTYRASNNAHRLSNSHTLPNSLKHEPMPGSGSKPEWRQGDGSHTWGSKPPWSNVASKQAPPLLTKQIAHPDIQDNRSYRAGLQNLSNETLHTFVGAHVSSTKEIVSIEGSQSSSGSVPNGLLSSQPEEFSAAPVQPTRTGREERIGSLWNSNHDVMGDADLPVDRMVRYIENSLEENHHESELGNIHIGHNSLRVGPPGQVPSLHEVHEPLYMRRSSSSSSQTLHTLSYAGALRKQPPPPPREPTPPIDPLDLLKNLNIKPSPGTQALYQYFS